VLDTTSRKDTTVNENLPAKSVDDLNLTDEQRHALNLIGVILKGKYTISGIDANDDSRVVVNNPDNVHMGRPFRVTTDGNVVMMRTDGDDLIDINPDDPTGAVEFAVLTLAVEGMFTDHPKKNEAFLGTAMLGVKLLAGVPESLLVSVIREGAVQEGLLPRD
jgi:hypothetical protein